MADDGGTLLATGERVRFGRRAAERRAARPHEDTLGPVRLRLRCPHGPGRSAQIAVVRGFTLIADDWRHDWRVTSYAVATCRTCLREHPDGFTWEIRMSELRQRLASGVRQLDIAEVADRLPRLMPPPGRNAL